MNILQKLENPERPFLGPNVKALRFWGLLLPENTIKRYLFITTHIIISVFVITECIDVWFVKSDIDLLAINLKITMLAIVGLCKMITFLYWQKHWKSIINYVTEADLYQRMTNDEKQMGVINNFTKYCRKITYLYWSLVFTTVLIVVVQPPIKYISSATYRENVKNENETYLQVISSWAPFDKNTIPGYIAASVYQTYSATFGGGYITSFDTNAIVTMVFFRAELELLRLECGNLFGRVEQPVAEEIAVTKLKDCHRRHVELVRFANLFDSCLSPIMLLYMFVCSVMLCVTAYQITTETNPMQQLLTTEYLIFGVAQLFIYCWHSNNVLFASQALMLGPYESNWWTRDVKCRKDLFMLTAQFSRNVVFSAGPFMKLTVYTFINILKGTYSYYTLLRQSQLK